MLSKSTRLLQTRAFSQSLHIRNLNERGHENVEEHRKAQTDKPSNPSLPSHKSTATDDIPSVGKFNAPPEMLSSVDPDFKPKDTEPGSTENTGAAQKA